MQRLPTRLPGLVLLAPAVHGDARGFFMETYRADAWAAEGVPTEFVQDNHSRSARGVVRGMITEHDTTEHNSQVFQLDRDDYTYIG